MSSGGAQSTLTAIVITLMGLIPLGLLAIASESPSAAAPASDAVVTVPTQATPGTALPDAALPRHEAQWRSMVTIPVPDIEGVSTPIARVLADRGFAGEETLEGVPESVIRVLEDHGAVLTIAVREG